MSNQIEVCKSASYVPVGKLKFHPNNPRTIRPERLEQLKRSITDKGFYQPILVWKKGGIVLAGNHRLLAAQELISEGWSFMAPNGATDSLPVVIEDVSEEVAQAILFETNNTYAEWVDERLRVAIEEAEELGRDVKSFGFTQDEIDVLLKDALKDAEDILGNKDDPEELEDDLLDPVFEPNIKDGDKEDSELKYNLTVVFEDGEALEELFIELRDRGFKVKI